MDTQEIDLLKLFLRDVSRIEPVKGREDYLPLTRRIERGRYFLNLADNSFENTFLHIQTNLQKTLGKFNAHCTMIGVPPLIPAEFEKQPEEFLDNPKIQTPFALISSLNGASRLDTEKSQQFKKLGWRCFYILSLFPPEMRATALTCKPNESILKHFKLVSQEYKQSRQRLIEGTLRYIIRIAMAYIGRGIPYLDLVQEGYFGLKHAADRFVEHEGAHFQQYASQWIQQRMLRVVADQSHLIRIPVHVHEKLLFLNRLELEYENELLINPNARDQEIIEGLGLSNGDISSKKTKNAVHKLKKLRESNAHHYPWDADIFAELLVDERNFEEFVDLELLNQAIQDWLQRIPARDREILLMRSGLADGEPKTLEDVGRVFGITRERVRQIESRINGQLEKQSFSYHFEDVLYETNHHIEAALNAHRRLLCDQLSAIDMHEAMIPDTTRVEQQKIEQLVEKRIMGGKRRLTARHGLTNRATLFVMVLTEANQPLYYQDIHQKTLALLPPEKYFTKEVAYATLFYHDRFRNLGNGIFALDSWQSNTEETTYGRVFAHCPLPLIPPNAHSRAFFEFILVARQIIQANSAITVRQFYEEMLSRLGRELNNPQDAFDAWYAAGLHEYIHFNQQLHEPMQLSIPTEWKLGEVRLHCLNCLCQRIAKMPELLAALDRLAITDVPMLQKILFGSESAGFDVPLRLNMLAAFEAVRVEGGDWRITDVGRAALRAHPPQELPDFSYHMVV